MTLSKAEWRAVRPLKLQNLEAAKLMEALRRRPAGTIEDWQDRLEKARELERVLNRTPRMLGRSMPEDYRAALKVWFQDIEDLRTLAHQQIFDLGLAYVDGLCTAIATTLQSEGLALIAAVEAQMRREARRAPEARDRRVHERLSADLAARQEVIRLLRRNRMGPHLRLDRMAWSLIRTKAIALRKFKMTCDPMLKGLAKAMATLQAEYDLSLGLEPVRRKGAALKPRAE
jgi:hypothetical protein